MPIESAKAKIESLASAFSQQHQQLSGGSSSSSSGGSLRRQDDVIITGDDLRDSYQLSVGSHYKSSNNNNAKSPVIGPYLPGAAPPQTSASSWGSRVTYGPKLPPPPPRTLYRGNGKVPRRQFPSQGMGLSHIVCFLHANLTFKQGILSVHSLGSKFCIRLFYFSELLLPPFPQSCHNK